MPKSKASSKRVKNHVTIDFEGLSESEKATLRDRGLIQEGVNINHISRRPIFMEPKFSTTPHFTHQYLALEPELTGKVLKVFHYVCSILEFDNWVDFSTVWVAEKMGLKRQQVSDALKILEKKGLLIRGEKIGRHYKWRLNPEAAWMGRATTRWDTVYDNEIPYSDFIEKRLQYGEEHDYPLGYLRGLRPLEGALSKPPKDLEKQKAYNRELRSRLYGEEYANGIEWKELTEAETARIHIRSAKIELEMKESGEWKELYEKYFPPEEKTKAEVIDIAEQVNRKKKAQKLAEELMSSDIDLDKLQELIRKSVNQ